MMNRTDAIRWIREIQGGSGVDRSQFPEALKGNLAKHCWDDEKFAYGIEYGVILALLKAYDIKPEDLRS